MSFNLRALVKCGFKIDLLAMPVGEDLEIAGSRTCRVPNVLGMRKLPIGPSPAKAFLGIFLFFKALSMCRKHSYDVIHGIEEAGFLAVMLGRLSGAAVVYEKHSDPASYRGGLLRNIVMSLYGGVEKVTMRRSTAVIGPGLVATSRETTPGVPAFFY